MADDVIASGEKIQSDGGFSPENLSVGEIEEPVRFAGNYPAIAGAIRAGGRLHAFLSGGGLRVLCVKYNGELIAYGEHPHVEIALAHAEDDAKVGGRSYDAVYGKIHPHFLTGASNPSSNIDRFLRCGRSFDIAASDTGFAMEAEYTREVRTPDDMIDRVIATGVSERWESRGFTYECSRDCRFARPGASTAVLASPPDAKGSDAWFDRVRVSCEAPTIEGLIGIMDDVFAGTFKD